MGTTILSTATKGIGDKLKNRYVKIKIFTGDVDMVSGLIQKLEWHASNLATVAKV